MVRNEVYSRMVKRADMGITLTKCCIFQGCIVGPIPRALQRTVL